MRLSILPALISLALSVIALPCGHDQIGDNDQIALGGDLERPDVYEYKEVEVTPKANAGLYLCATRGFKGKSTISHEFLPGLSGGVSAAGPDPGSWRTLYSENNCHGQELQLHYPGYADLAMVHYSNKAASYNCAAE